MSRKKSGEYLLLPLQQSCESKRLPHRVGPEISTSVTCFRAVRRSLVRICPIEKLDLQAFLISAVDLDAAPRMTT